MKVSPAIKKEKRLTKKKLKKDKNVNFVELKLKDEIIKTPQQENKAKAKKTKYIMPSESVTDDLVSSSLNALQQLVVHYTRKNKLLEDEVVIFAEVRCIKIQSAQINIRLVLPHGTYASTGEICLITPDIKKGKKKDHQPTIDLWEEKLRSAGVTNVKTILPLRQLRVEYDQYELKRRLLTQHDFIMVDTRILQHATHELGNLFLKKHNMLIPVRMDEANIKKSIDVGLRTVMMRLTLGETSSVIVGHTGMPQNHLKENVISLVDQLRTRYPGGEANIRSISLKLPLSLPLPLYVTLRSSNTVEVPRIQLNKPNDCIVLEDELSTIPGSIVKVGPEGTVRLIKTKRDDADKDLSADNDENEDSDDQSDEEME